MRILPLLAATLIAQPAFADVSVRFFEGAPKDRFVIVSDSGVCANGPVRVTVDLTGSAGALIFDVTGQGAGVEVFQPFELVSGQDSVTGASQVSDGDRTLVLEMNALPAGFEVAFTIDLDDTIGQREITVSGSEIVGASFTVEAGDQSATAVFGENASAALPWDACVS